MITIGDRRTNLEKTGALKVGKTHNDWVTDSLIWHNDPREISRAQHILSLAEETDNCLKSFLDKRDLPNTSKGLKEKAAPGFEKAVKAMKKQKGISNPWALSWWMHNQGYKAKTGKGKK